MGKSLFIFNIQWSLNTLIEYIEYMVVHESSDSQDYLGAPRAFAHVRKPRIRAQTVSRVLRWYHVAPL